MPWNSPTGARTLTNSRSGARSRLPRIDRAPYMPPRIESCIERE
jgi:hypothetical protein